MKKQHIFLYFGLVAILLAVSIVLFIMDGSPVYYEWPRTVFVLSAMVAIGSLIFLSVYPKKNEMTHTIKETVEWFRFLSISMMTILIAFMYFVASANVIGPSMDPTLSEGELLLVYHFNYVPELNDIIVIDVNSDDFPLYSGSERFFVKRIYAVPGDMITFEYKNTSEDYILLNGEYLTNIYGEKYRVSHSDLENERENIELSLNLDGSIKDDCYLALGDNEDNSTDSRNIGLVHREDIVGEVVYSLMPFGGLA